MNDSLPAQALIGVATVVAALITGVIAVVNLTLSKEQKVSELRQAWIDGLREDLAKFLSGARFIAVSLNDARQLLQLNADPQDSKRREKLSEQTAIVQESLYRIKLRLNSREPDHMELERLLEAVLSTWNVERMNPSIEIHAEVIRAVEAVATHARGILKTEWERVKRGEDAFVKLKNWLLPSILAVTGAFIFMLLWAKLK